MEQENIRFEKSDLPPDIIKVKVGKDGAPLTPQETLTVKMDYSDCVCVLKIPGCMIFRITSEGEMQKEISGWR